jgi:hypothetical protein
MSLYPAVIDHIAGATAKCFPGAERRKSGSERSLSLFRAPCSHRWTRFESGTQELMNPCFPVLIS